MTATLRGEGFGAALADGSRPLQAASDEKRTAAATPMEARDFGDIIGLS
jgi:hypothetical protein